MNVAVIPARGGSKRIPRKNIKPFAGKPVIAYAISAAQSSGLFAHVVVSTDDDEIAQIARDCGAETPFVRPRELADDTTPTVQVMVHAIKACEPLGWTIADLCCIYPAVPFLKPGDLKAALDLFCTSQADYCFPVVEFPSAIQRALRIGEAGRLSPFSPQHELTRTQDLDAAYYDAGQFYWGSSRAWLSNSRIHSNSVGLVLPAWRVVDIDTPDDWHRAELLHQVMETFVEHHIRAGV